MSEPRFQYPADDNIPYLSWFEGQFSSVFVALNPFVHLPHTSTHGPWTEAIPGHVLIGAIRCGEACDISWLSIAKRCDFPSIRHVNRALRLTGSRRIVPTLASETDTDTLLSVCRTDNVFPPDEGVVSPLLRLSIARMLAMSQQQHVVVAAHYGVDAQCVSLEDLSAMEGRSWFSELWAPDGSVFMSTYFDYHYTLIGQTDASRRTMPPHMYCEGFYADLDTDDFWGIGELS